MKRILPFLFSIIFSAPIFGQCPGLINKLTHILLQEEVDSFSHFYPNCINIDNSLAVIPAEAPHTYIIPTVTDLTGLDQIRSVSEWAAIYSADHMKTFKGLNGLESVGGGIQFLLNDSLTEIHPNSFSNLIDIGSNLIIEQNPQLEKISGFPSLERIGNELKISENPVLNSIEEIGEIGFRGMKTLKIETNPQLSVCNQRSICEFLAIGGNASIFGNAPGCQSVDEVKSQCDIEVAKIRFGAFYDLNQDGIHQQNEPFHIDASINIEPNIYDIPVTQDSLGTYFVELGNYSATLDTLENWDLTTPEIVQLNLNTTNECDTVLFGIFPNQKLSKLSSGYFPPPFRCGTTLKTDLVLKNTGTSLTSGILWFQLDSLAKFQFIEAPDTFINQYLVGWKFQNFFPGTKIEKEISLIPPINFNLGDQLKFRSYAKFNDGTEDLISQAFHYSKEIRCSYDPNDKLVNPSRTGNYTLFEEDLTYTIRFQNTGNDYAYDVVIRDTLDENLDPSTFQVLNSSHYELLNTTIENDRFIAFEFKDIFLPDSTTNFDESQGYVSYLIEPKDDLVENTPINNTASIYFDFNPPIVTNTTENIMVSELPTNSTQSIDNQLVVNIFPNPSTGTIFIKGDNLENAKITISDITGQVLKVEKLNTSGRILLPKTASGMFFLKVKTEKGAVVKRIFKH